MKIYYNILFYNHNRKNDNNGLCEKAFALENELSKEKLKEVREQFKKGKSPLVWIIENQSEFFGDDIQVLDIDDQTYKGCKNDKEFYKAMQHRFGYQVIDGCRVYDDHKDCVICDGIRGEESKTPLADKAIKELQQGYTEEESK